MNPILSIAQLQLADCEHINKAFTEQGWTKPTSQYQAYFEEQAQGVREVLVAKLNGQFAGYLTIVWESGFLGFREKGIPEIVDFNVLQKFQRQGIGTRLMEEAEAKIKQRASHAGIAFGATSDYGAAQILYIKRGYIPWGNGLSVEGRSLDYGDQITVDDALVFHLSKAL